MESQKLKQLLHNRFYNLRVLEYINIYLYELDLKKRERVKFFSFILRNFFSN